MSDSHKLVLVKTVHTLIWIFYNLIIVYMLYASITDHIDGPFWVCTGLVLLEGLILLLFKFTCPLTLIARRYSNSQKNNFDIYLPEWLAKNTKRVYSTIVVVIAIIAIFQFCK